MTRRLVSTMACVVACLMLASCSDDDGQTISDVTVSEAVDLIGNNSDNTGFVILDVRTPAEFEPGHLKNAVNIDFRAADFEARLRELDRHATYLVYCGSGMRSAQAVEMMRELDFRKVYNVLGGFAALQNSAPCVCIFEE